jgi:hypothetical protein
MVNEVDLMIPRPRAGQVSDHQLGAPDAVADAVFYVQADLHAPPPVTTALLLSVNRMRGAGEATTSPSPVIL